ncbi:hypothetical protein [Emergencia timonensis]|uniref:hypothetical protein n=1 Tax=Emergencia timonensis TaxID=1776384 RepID=UPI000834EE18|nr:hypothetical protein [Emergencia timonensis]
MALNTERDKSDGGCHGKGTKRFFAFIVMFWKMQVRYFTFMPLPCDKPIYNWNLVFNCAIMIPKSHGVAAK